MMQRAKEKILVFTGAGVSAESGLKTFRDSGGLWESMRIEEVATPEAWERDPAKVLDFYNMRRKAAAQAKPNPAHLAIAQLETAFDVAIVTQNVDDLHERAGSSRVIRLHGNLSEAKSELDPSYRIPYPLEGLSLDDRCPRGGRLRPHIVWFGEAVENYELALEEVSTAGRMLVVGTSLSVYPAAGLVSYARPDAEKVLVAMDIDACPEGFEFFKGRAGEILPKLAQKWLSEKNR
ncbi:NAD-dependent deacylase [Pelagicoccus sp. SDUM812003]|uniref:SIR2 family NAD-dependent protein deacylase n=1 Tax=Pelagicoccus sp. SDUM812003 TaxID=3041267 RepID=UPI0028107A0B|nr:NAD-dependent deacylase [Pelagicoccus sp. SDUM812003]MDQ8201773.1 NAD-dependent deacylase [Pelagicoccus sp. SDUM812003]